MRKIHLKPMTKVERAKPPIDILFMISIALAIALAASSIAAYKAMVRYDAQIQAERRV